MTILPLTVTAADANQALFKLLEAARPDKSGKEGPESAQEETEASAKK